jgi:hypothetical protein
VALSCSPRTNSDRATAARTSFYLTILNPFADEKFLAAIVTTTLRSFAVPLTDDDFETGKLPRQSYASP